MCGARPGRRHLKQTTTRMAGSIGATAAVSMRGRGRTVPELQKRTISTDGTASITTLASSFCGKGVTRHA